MRLRSAFLFFIPLVIFAQAPAAPTAPPEVDRALRERATAFFQYQVEGNFRKAYDLVAEDTRDYYFAIAKTKILSFTIDEIAYTDDFSRASVRATTVRKTSVAGNEFEIPGSVTDLWKVEDGKWFWYHDPKQDSPAPFFAGLVNGDGAKTSTEPADAKALPKDTSPTAVAAAAAGLMQPSSVSKTSLTFTQGKPGIEEVTFHNGNRGQVEISAWVVGRPKGFTVEPGVITVNALSDVTLKIHYDPAVAAETKEEVRFRIEVEPFDTWYLLPVKFVPDSSSEKR